MAVFLKHFFFFFEVHFVNRWKFAFLVVALLFCLLTRRSCWSTTSIDVVNGAVGQMQVMEILGRLAVCGFCTL